MAETETLLRWLGSWKQELKRMRDDHETDSPDYETLWDSEKRLIRELIRRDVPGYQVRVMNPKC